MTPEQNEPDPIGLGEMEWMLSCRPNVLFKAANEASDAALLHITEWISTPLHVCQLPGPAQLPVRHSGALLLRDVDALDAQQQAAVMDWLDLNAGNVQVISATATDLFAAVERGTFSERLYYRLNTILAEFGVVNDQEAWVVGRREVHDR